MYSVILIPISILRIYEFSGNSVPFELTATAGVLFNYMGPFFHFVSNRPLIFALGFINVVFLIYTERWLPKSNSILPEFSAKRQQFRYSIAKSGGVIPFTFQRSEVHHEYMMGRAQRVVVHLPTKPPNTFVAPDSWKSSAPKGKLYLWRVSDGHVTHDRHRLFIAHLGWSRKETLICKNTYLWWMTFFA